MNLLEKVSKQHKKWVKLALKLGAGSYAEDIIQEVYLRLHQYSSLSKVLNKENEVHDGYMYFVIRNTVFTYLAANKKINKIPIENFYEEFDSHSISEIKSKYLEKLTQSDNSDHENAFWEICQRMDEELETWEWYDRKIFQIYRDNKKSIRQLAKETGISWVNIFYTLKRGKDKMRELFKEDYEDYKNEDYEKL